MWASNSLRSRRVSACSFRSPPTASLTLIAGTRHVAMFSSISDFTFMLVQSLCQPVQASFVIELDMFLASGASSELLVSGLTCDLCATCLHAQDVWECVSDRIRPALHQRTIQTLTWMSLREIFRPQGQVQLPQQQSGGRHKPCPDRA